MATFTVTTAADFIGGDGQRSLREAVNSANATPEADRIVFAPALEGQTLTLTQGELQLTQDITIDGDADNDGGRVTLSGGWSGQWAGETGSRILNIIGDTTDVGLTDVALTNGYSAKGAGVLMNGGSLSLLSSSIGHSCGGAIYAVAGSRLSIADSDITDNGALGLTAGIYVGNGGSLILERSRIEGNINFETSFGGGISLYGATATVSRSLIASNFASDGGAGIDVRRGSITINDSTLADNYSSYGAGGLYLNYGANAIVRNSTITDNIGVGIEAVRPEEDSIEIFNSIVAGNGGYSIGQFYPGDINGSLVYSNGHNVFSTNVAGATSGDRENAATSTIFTGIDSLTGGGLLGADGLAHLRESITNPALGGADRFAAMTFDQVGLARPQPTGTVPDIGAVESARAPSTTASANNDLLTGTSAANTISGLAGNDFIRGMAGNDRLAGGDGSDLLDGGAGNDRLDGGTGIDSALFGGSTAVVVDLSGATDTARRGSETDTLVSIEGAIGSSAADTFRGDAAGNKFMGGDGRDIYTGGAGRDLFDFNTVNDSRVGASLRDLITDFIVGQDRIDLAGIDADAIRAGDQAFRWVGSTAFAANRPGEVGWFTSGTNTIIHASTDADSADELQLQLTGNIGASLAASDFHL